MFEVLNECRRALVDALGDSGDGVLDPAVVIPAAVVKVYETHAALGQSSGEYAVAGEGSVSGLGSVEVKDVLGFVGDVHQFGNAGLHAEGHLVLAYLGGDLGIAQGCVAGEVELVDRVDEGALVFCGYAFGVAQVEHGVAFAVKMDALVLAGEKSAVPLA